MILADSSVWIDYFRGVICWQTDMLDQLLQTEPVLMADLIFAEVLQGFRSDKDFAKAKKLLSGLPFHQIGGYEVALQSALNYRILRKQGITVRKTIDVFIGTFCILNRITLLHNDIDFDTLVKHLTLKTVKQA